MSVFKIDNAFLRYLLSKAKGLRDDAGYGGRFDDGGSGALESQVACYGAGLEGRVPAIWDNYVKEYQKINDPDWAEFQRLKRKFE